MKRMFTVALAVLLLLTAAGITAYPLISNYVNDQHQSTVRTEFAKEIETRNDAEIQAAKQAAQAYNESLQPIRYDREAVRAAEERYYDLLDLTGSGIMGYVEIPKIEVSLPIYHGTEEDILEKGVGHLIGSSLPVGGDGCHSVLTGHSGVAGKRLFSDLEQLRQGDIFYLHILGDTLAYEVTEINTVLPYETELLTAEPGEDLCTLITCVPYGVNTHRLLVRGSRVPYTPVTEQTVTKGKAPIRSMWKDQYQKGLLLGSGASLGAVMLGLLLATALRKRRKRNET